MLEDTGPHGLYTGALHTRGSTGYTDERPAKSSFFAAQDFVRVFVLQSRELNANRMAT